MLSKPTSLIRTFALGILASWLVLVSVPGEISAQSVESRSALEQNPEGWLDLMPDQGLTKWRRVPVPPGGNLGRQQWHLDETGKVLVCDGDGGHDMLLYAESFEDAIFHLECRYTRIAGKMGYNSGAYVRNSEDGAIWHQAQFGDGKDGFLFGETPTADGKKKFFNLAKEVKDGRVKPAGEWNTIEITARGRSLSLWVNGAVTCEFKDCGAPSGYVGLEGEGYRIEFRNLKVKRLSSQAADRHRFSTLFTAQDVRDRLSSTEGLRDAIDWCKNTSVSKVYVESFRDGYQAKPEDLDQARKAFRAAGIEVSGCVTPTSVGKKSTGWNIISCYTDPGTQEKIRAIFDFTARHFDEIMIDDFWFTDCTCADCEQGRHKKSAVVAGKAWPVSGDTWEDYRCELMARISQELVIKAAKAANPDSSLIIKYPQWYDRFHERGYEVLRETAMFDRIWVGTETRDYNDQRWGGTPQYEAYFIMRWLGGIGGPKCGGGWYDPYGTTEATYLEQARQTILAGAEESLLFCYGSLLTGTGPKNIQALRQHQPELLAVAKEVSHRKPIGVAAYKPANSHPGKEPRVFDFVGMLGLPLVPCHEFPTEAPAAFFSFHALKDPELAHKLSAFIEAGKPVLVTDGLAGQLQGKVDLTAASVRILPVKGEPKTLLELSDEELSPIREPLLKPFAATFRAPNRVALYLFSDGSSVVENFNDTPALVHLSGKQAQVGARAWLCQWK